MCRTSYWLAFCLRVRGPARQDLAVELCYDILCLIGLLIFPRAYVLDLAVLKRLKQGAVSLTQPVAPSFATFETLQLSPGTEISTYRLRAASALRTAHSTVQAPGSRLQAKHAKMPHSDNLYSVEDSDAESFSDELSPADGYFNRGHMSANAMVTDPSIEDTKPEAKTLIPPHLQESAGRSSRISSHQSSSLPSQSYASVQSAHNSSPSHATHTPISPVSSRRLDDLFPRQPASTSNPPPAYSAAPEPTTSSSQEPVRRSYSTFPEQQLEQGFLPRREPESMGGPEEDPSESTPLSRESRKRSPCRRFIRNLLLVALILTVTTTLLSAIFGGVKTVSPSFLFQRPL